MTCCVSGIKHIQTFTQHFGALQNVSPSQLADRELFDFEALDSEREFDFKGECSTEDEPEENKRL